MIIVYERRPLGTFCQIYLDLILPQPAHFFEASRVHLSSVDYIITLEKKWPILDIRSASSTTTAL
jgi:hypothetical protein